MYNTIIKLDHIYDFNLNILISETVSNNQKRKILNKYSRIISVAKNTIETEGKAILNLANLVDDEFAKAVSYIYNSHGRVIIAGIGKSANIATKIVAT